MDMLDRLRALARPLEDLPALVGDARLVLLGEATHGTQEFYAVRAQLTRHLVTERGFRGVALEADWPATARVNDYVQGVLDEADPRAALGDFAGRFPVWMWRNEVVLDLVRALRGTGAGVYGLDLYGLRASMAQVVEYLDSVDPEAAARARSRYACFDALDEQEYGYAAARGEKESCEDAVVAQLVELRERAAELAARDGQLPRNAHFFAQQNARLAADAERYYRSMFRGRASSWNLRDEHMADTLDTLVEHLDGAGIAVWAHNSHLGDARATSFVERGELNVGQLVRERHGGECLLVGFTTHTGTVTAAREWDGPAERRQVRPSLAGSVERLLHDAGIPAGVLDLRGEAGELLREERLERMIGVIYRPESERVSHYVAARVAEQFDLLVHIDETRAVVPLDPADPQRQDEPGETYPSGL